MTKIACTALGVLAVLAIQGLAVSVIVARAHGWSARAEPSRMEQWVARRARDAAMPAEARNQANPVPNTAEVLADARAHWADHCASCHANDGSGDSLMGKRLYPPAPDMRGPATQNLTDGELFYVIQNGVRLTGMPAWGGSDHDAEDTWKLVHFIRHLPALATEERVQMEKLTPRVPMAARKKRKKRNS